MDLPALLYSLLTTGAALLATNAAGEFAKGAGKSAWEALKARLAGAHKVDGLDMLDKAREKPAFGEAIKAELAAPAVAADPEVISLARRLEAAFAALPPTESAPYAVAIREIHAGRDLLFENVAGVQSDLATSEGDMTFRNVTMPGKP
jgi:hypothetical protein